MQKVLQHTPQAEETIGMNTVYPARPMRYHRWRPVEREHLAILKRWQAKQRKMDTALRPR